MIENEPPALSPVVSLADSSRGPLCHSREVRPDMDGERFLLRHAPSGTVLSDGRSPLVFAAAAGALAFALRFGCEPGGFEVQALTEGPTEAA